MKTIRNEDGVDEAVGLDYPKATSNINGPDGRVLRTELRLSRIEAFKTRGGIKAAAIMDGVVLERLDIT